MTIRDRLHAAIGAREALPTDADDTPAVPALYAAYAALPDGQDAAAWADYEAAVDAHDARIRELDAAITDAQEALRESDEPRTYTIRDESRCTIEIEATGLAAARRMAEEWVREGDYSDADGTVYPRYWIEGEDGSGDDGTVTIAPAEPDCGEADEHDWHSPHSVVGGIKENPGVWGHGGGVTIRRVCCHCGAYQVTDTWATDPETGEQGVESVRYEEADDESLEWIASRARRRAKL